MFECYTSDNDDKAYGRQGVFLCNTKKSKLNIMALEMKDIGVETLGN